MKNRKGEIKVDRIHLDYYILNHLEDNLVFKDFLPTSISMDYMTNQITFKGYCKHFRELQDGEIIPEYDVVIDVDDEKNKIKNVRFVEKTA
jgi:hypothetical protein